MSDLDDQLVQFSKLAIQTAARELGIDAVTLARRLNQGEIARLIHLLNACHAHVQHGGLRHRTEDLLMAVTDGRMPDHTPESELDWALKVAHRRRSAAESEVDDEAPDED